MFSPRHEWTPYKDYSTIGQIGPDDGIILRDETYIGNAHVTLERANPHCHGGCAIIFAVHSSYHSLGTTEYYDTEEEAQRVYDDVKQQIACICDLAEVEDEDPTATERMDGAIESLARQFGLH